MKYPDVKTNVLHSISESRPLSKWYFRLLTAIRGIVIAIMMVLSGFVLLGAYSVLTEESLQYLGYVERLSYRAGMIALPILWIIIFLIFMWAILGMVRSLRYGYRIRLPIIIGGFIVGSLLMSVIIGLVSRGRAIYLVRYPITVAEDFIWNQPNKGRLSGTIVDQEDKSIVIRDTVGYQWSVNTEYLLPRSKDTIASDAKVRIVGFRTEEFGFTACQVFPWRQNNMIGQGSIISDDALYAFEYSEHSDTVDAPIREVCDAIIDK